MARNGCRWPIFARNARITLRIRQETGTECYGASADDRNTTSGSTGCEYSTSRVTGSTFLLSRCFRIADLPVQTTVFAVSVKSEMVVSRPEVVLRDRKWIPPAHTATPITPSMKEFSVSTPSPLLLSIWLAPTRRLFGRPLQVAVRHMLYIRDRCPVCLSVTLVYCGHIVR